MHQLHPLDGGNTGPNLWTWLLLLAAGLLTGFAATAALWGNIIWLFLMFGVFLCLYSVWLDLQNMPQGKIKGNPLKVIKFAFARALHRTVLETPEVSISDKTLRVGQDFIILYQQCFNQPVHLSRFTISLVLRQELTQEGAEGDHVDTAETVVKILERSREDIPSGLFCAQKSFSIPVDGIPNFTIQLKDRATHSGTWLLRTRIEVAGLPAFMNEYGVFVDPKGASKWPPPLEERNREFGFRYKLVK